MNGDKIKSVSEKNEMETLEEWVPIEEIYSCPVEGWFLFENGKIELGESDGDKMYPYNAKGSTFRNGTPIMFCDLREPKKPSQQKETQMETLEQLIERAEPYNYPPVSEWQDYYTHVFTLTSGEYGLVTKFKDIKPVCKSEDSIFSRAQWDQVCKHRAKQKALRSKALDELTELSQKQDLGYDVDVTKKQTRYIDLTDKDWIDEFAKTASVDEFRGAMRFTIGKYNRRVGKKDEIIKEIEEMKDYCQRWIEYEEKLDG